MFEEKPSVRKTWEKTQNKFRRIMCKSFKNIKIFLSLSLFTCLTQGMHGNRVFSSYSLHIILQYSKVVSLVKIMLF